MSLREVPAPQQIREIELRLDQNTGNLESMETDALLVYLVGLREEIKRVRYWTKRHKGWYGPNIHSQQDKDELERCEHRAEQVKEQLQKRTK